MRLELPNKLENKNRNYIKKKEKKRKNYSLFQIHFEFSYERKEVSFSSDPKLQIFPD